MSIHSKKAHIAAILVMVLLLSPVMTLSVRAVTEPDPAVTEPAETTAAAPTEPVPTETAPTEPEATEPETPGPVLLPPDPETAIYQICDRLAQETEGRHLFVYHTGTGQMLYSKTVGNGKLFPASITKLFSTYVALQYLDPDTVITAGSELNLVHEGSSIAYIAKGNQLRVKMLVEAMLLPSGNDAAMVLAAAAGRVIAQDENMTPEEAVNTFVDEMNRQAELLGFEKTHFTSPDGWHAGSHYTCLNDLARISALALENETIRRYMKVGYHETNFYSGQAIAWENTNLLVLPGSGFYRTDAVGMKTGYTKPAGYCLMSAFTFEEGEIVIGQFGYVSKNNRFIDAINLVKAVKDQLRLEAATEESVG